MQVCCRLVSPNTLTAHPKKMSVLLKHHYLGANLVNMLGVTQCDSLPPPPPPTPLKILGCQTLLGMNVKNIFLNFYSNTRPCVLHTNQKQLQSHSGDYHNRSPIDRPHIRSQWGV